MNTDVFANTPLSNTYQGTPGSIYVKTSNNNPVSVSGCSFTECSARDETNTHAGLGGNIRLLGSIHPKTLEKVHIVNGEFLDICDDDIREKYYEQASYYVKSIYKITNKEYNVKKEITEKRIIENKRKWLNRNTKWGHDPIAENDLREVIPRLYGGTVRKYGDYIFMQCPWHADRNPSLKVKKEWFYCTGCGKKGNIWTLIKNGELKKMNYE